MAADKANKEESVSAQSKDPKQHGEQDTSSSKKDAKNKKDSKTEEELSAEDQQLQDDLDLLVERCQDKNAELAQQALVQLQKQISSSTTSMTSVPKPLKFLAKHFQTLRSALDNNQIGESNKGAFADIVSVLAMTNPKSIEEADDIAAGTVLKYKMLGASTDVGCWGHPYVHHLTAELQAEFKARVSSEAFADRNVDDLQALIEQILEYDFKHNAEADACDLLMEVDQLEAIKAWIPKDSTSFKRVCHYLLTTTGYVVDTEEFDKTLRIVYDVFMQHKQYPDALRVAIKMDDKDLMTAVFEATDESDTTVRNQLGFILGSQKLTLPAFEDDDDMMEIIGNVRLSEHYHTLATELDLEAAKMPEDIYKSHLEEPNRRSRARRDADTSAKVDSAKQNLASTFVNAFVHAGFGKDLLMTPDKADWLYKNKDHGMMSAAASIGMIMLWDLDLGYSACDKFSSSQNNHIQAGSLFASGMVSSGVTSDFDASFALLSEHLEDESQATHEMKLAAINGLGLAYAGTAREDILELLTPLLDADDHKFELCAFAALTLGLVFIGTSSDEVSGAILQLAMEISPTQQNDSLMRFVGLGLGLVFLGKGESAETMVEALSVVEHPVAETLKTTVTSLAYAGTGNVLQIQKLLRTAAQHLPSEEEQESSKQDGDKAQGDDPMDTTATSSSSSSTDDKKKDDKGEDESVERQQWQLNQSAAVLGLAGVAMGEELGAEMVLRSLDNILQYGEQSARRAVPLALALLHVSNPDFQHVDTLSRLSHDEDELVSQNAIMGLGLLGAGTNNSRIAKALRQLALFYHKEPNHLFLVRIAQGLVHAGKGLLTLSPYHSDGMLLNKIALGGLLTVLHASLSMKSTILSSRHWLLYWVVLAMRPRMLVALDEKLEPMKLDVRVGTAVDTVRQAGKPKSITGFQTHATPVLLSRTDRAELASDKYLASSSVLEGFVILRPNPDWVDPDQDEPSTKDKESAS